MVYFLHSPEQCSVKIGFARSVSKRISSIQCSNSSKLVLIGSIPGDRGKEWEIHGRFREFRIRGEWFRATDFLLYQIYLIISESLESGGSKEGNWRIFNFQIPEDQDSWLKSRSSETGVPMSEILRRLIQLAMNSEGEQRENADAQPRSYADQQPRIQRPGQE